MKNRFYLVPKKTYFVCVCVFVLNIVIPVFSFSNFWWNIPLNFEGKTGSTDELVFENNKKISLLEWNIPFLPTISLNNQIGLSSSSFTKLDNVVFGLDSEYFSISVGIIFTLT